MNITDKLRRKIANRPYLLLIVAAVVHVGVATAVYEVGKHQLAPNQIYPSGIGKFAADGLIYEKECLALSQVIRSQGARAWLTWPTQLHVRLYSLPFALSRQTTFSIITIEPLNLVYYLGILALIFLIGQSLFDRATGLVAAAIIGLWPSILLHSTQLLRDPLLLIAVLMLCLPIVTVLNKPISWRSGLIYGLSAVLALLLIRIVRIPMWRLVAVVVAIAIGMFLLRMILLRKVMAGAIVCAAFLLAGVVIIPRFQDSYRSNQQVNAARVSSPAEYEVFSTEKQVEVRRRIFGYHLEDDGNFSVAQDGSRIDREVQFGGPMDIARYLPRATVVGLWAPFPNMWFSQGKQVGSSGRGLSGFEMSLTYVLEILALIGLWSRRRSLAAWFLFGFILLGCVALGLVASNVGALYRLRYPFWIMIVILGAGGLMRVIRNSYRKTSTQTA